jgi:hypothetical protein
VGSKVAAFASDPKVVRQETGLRGSLAQVFFRRENPLLNVDLMLSGPDYLGE